MIKIVRSILQYTGIFRISLVEDKDEQEEYTKVVMIVGAVVIVMLSIIKLSTM